MTGVNPGSAGTSPPVIQDVFIKNEGNVITSRVDVRRGHECALLGWGGGGWPKIHTALSKPVLLGLRLAHQSPCAYREPCGVKYKTTALMEFSPSLKQVISLL